MKPATKSWVPGVIAIAMAGALWFSGFERYRGLVVTLLTVAALCVAGFVLVMRLTQRQRAIWVAASALWICWALASIYWFWSEQQHSNPALEVLLIGLFLLVPTITIVPFSIWLLSVAAVWAARR